MSDEPEGAVRTETGERPAADESSDASTQAARRTRRRRGSRGRGRGSSGRPGAATDTAPPERPEAGGEQVEEAGAQPGVEDPGQAAGAAGERPAGPRRRRRRGGRGRGRSRTPAGSAEAEEAERAEAESPESPEEPGGEAPEPDAEASSRKSGAQPKKPATRTRRRRTTTRKPATAGAEQAPDKAAGETAEEAAVTAAEAGAETAAAEPRPARARRTRTRKPAAETAEKPTDESKAPPTRRTRTRKAAVEAGGPTRTRRVRTPGRRHREDIPLPPRVQDKVMLITERGDRDQIAVLEDRELVEHYITRAGAHSMVGNIYLGRVQNVLPGMEAAFIDIGRGRNAVLYAGEVSYDEEIEGRPPRIEQVIRAGQALMVQVTKDPIGGKGPRLTQEISLPGRYLVLVPSSQVFGISRRLPDDERRRLRALVRKVRPEQHGVIVRTAAEGAGEAELAADVERLVEEWEGIAKRAKKVKAPHVLYEEPELTVRVVRDLFNDEEFKEMVTDSTRVFEQITAYLQSVAPDLVERVHLYDRKLPLLEHYHVIEQIHKALERKVWLPSGGYIIIERTEAMTVIDVNTGKHVGKTNLEETVVGTNLEAAEEIGRQLRLRDIGGIIIIDFIDMLLEQNRDKIIQTMRQALARDKTRSQVFSISPLGILEVTRKRVSAGLLESFSETCPTCGGRGILLTHEI